MSDLQNRLTAVLGRDVNLNHEKMSDLILELIQKLEQYQTEYQDTVKAIQKHYAEGKR
jgi:hypothetical protein